jgi:hypothetical protein
MRICADCTGHIKRGHRWQIDGCRVRHISCANPTLRTMALPLGLSDPPCTALPDPASPGFTHLSGMLDAAIGDPQPIVPILDLERIPPHGYLF